MTIVELLDRAVVMEMKKLLLRGKVSPEVVAQYFRVVGSTWYAQVNTMNEVLATQYSGLTVAGFAKAWCESKIEA